MLEDCVLRRKSLPPKSKNKANFFRITFPPPNRRYELHTEIMWSCSACTFENEEDVFHCGICMTQKGTSSRNSRVTSRVVMESQLEYNHNNSNGQRGKRRRIASSTSSLSLTSNSSNNHKRMMVTA
jgi:hypothetical protein